MNFLAYQNRELFFDSTSISEVAKKYKTPFYLYSETALMTQFKSFQQAVGKHNLGDNLICFALKANPNP